MIHFAGLKAVGESVANPRRYFDFNLVGTINLYEIMAKYNCKKVRPLCFIFALILTMAWQRIIENLWFVFFSFYVEFSIWNDNPIVNDIITAVSK